MNGLYRHLIPLLMCIAIAAMVAALFRAFSARAAASSSCGTALVSVTPSTVFRATGKYGDEVIAKFTVQNTAGTPVTLLGASSECSCTVADGLPLTLPAHSAGNVYLRVTVGHFDEGGIFAKTAILFANRAGDIPPLHVEITHRLPE
jgi:hypothetical protein